MLARTGPEYNLIESGPRPPVFTSSLQLTACRRQRCNAAKVCAHASRRGIELLRLLFSPPEAVRLMTHRGHGTSIDRRILHRDRSPRWDRKMPNVIACREMAGQPARIDLDRPAPG